MAYHFFAPFERYFPWVVIFIVLSQGAPHELFPQPTRQAEFLTLSSVRFQLAWPPVVIPPLFLSDTNLSLLWGKQALRDSLLSYAIFKPAPEILLVYGTDLALPSSPCDDGRWAVWSSSSHLLYLGTQVPSQGFDRTLASEPSPQGTFFREGCLRLFYHSRDGFPVSAFLYISQEMDSHPLFCHLLLK